MSREQNRRNQQTDDKTLGNMPVKQVEGDSLVEKLKGLNTPPLHDEEPAQQRRSKLGPPESGYTP